MLFSEDLPVVIEIIESCEHIQSLVELLEGMVDIGLLTCAKVAALRRGEMRAIVTAAE